MVHVFYFFIIGVLCIQTFPNGYLYREGEGPGKRGNICCGHKFCVWDSKNVSDFDQKHFVSATNVSQFAQPKKRQGQQCVRNDVSSFAWAYMAKSPLPAKSPLQINCRYIIIE